MAKLGLVVVVASVWLMATMANCDISGEDWLKVEHQHRLVKRQQPVQYGQPTDQTSGFLAGLGSLAQQAQTMTQAQQLIQSIFQPKQQTQTPIESAFDTAQGAGGSSLGAASQTAQTGLRSTMTELSQGLQRLTANNPNLLPDIKTLYQRVSSTMGSSSNQLGGQSGTSNIVPANNQEELADNLAKVAVPGLQIGQPAPPQPGIVLDQLFHPS